MDFTCLYGYYLRSVARGQQLFIDTNTKAYPVLYPLYLEDKNGNLGVEDILQMSFKRAAQKTPDFLGDFSKAVWYKIEVTNKSNEPDWYLEVKGGFMHQLNLYEIPEEGGIKEQELFADSAFNLKKIKSNNVIFPVHISPGQARTFYLRASSKTLIMASVQFASMQHLYEQSVYTSYGNGFFSALAAALLLYNLFVYFSLRENVYLYYILYISLYIIHNNIVSGDLQIMFPQTGVLHSNILLPLMGVSSILFTNSFLQSDIYAVFFYRIRWIMASLYIIPLCIYFYGHPQLAIAVVSAIMYVLFFYWIAAGITAYRNGFKPAIYFIAGFGALILCNVIFGLKIKGFLGDNYWLDSSLYIGTALEALILSFALAKKINFYKKEKEKLQELSYRQAVDFSHELINLQESERKRIASELHDSVGQKLILIKNKILRPAKKDKLDEHNGDLAEHVADVIQEIRSISYALRPYQMDLLGLTQSVKSLAEETFDAAGIHADINIYNIDKLFSTSNQMNIYRIIQECLNNIVKHSHAQKGGIEVLKNSDSIQILIWDNGIGIDQQNNPKGLGLRGIHERLQIIQGSINIEDIKLGGTKIEINIPLLTTG